MFFTKKHNYEQIKLNKLEEFDLHNIIVNLKHIPIYSNIYKDDDPKELYTQ